MNQDYVTEYKAQTVDGVQTVTFKINPRQPSTTVPHRRERRQDYTYAAARGGPPHLLPGGCGASSIVKTETDWPSARSGLRFDEVPRS